jgi:hypothetical protein
MREERLGLAFVLVAHTPEGGELLTNRLLGREVKAVQHWHDLGVLPPIPRSWAFLIDDDEVNFREESGGVSMDLPDDLSSDDDTSYEFLLRSLDALGRLREWLPSTVEEDEEWIEWRAEQVREGTIEEKDLDQCVGDRYNVPPCDTCTHTYTYMRTYTYTRTYTRILNLTHTPTQTCTHAHIHVYTQPCVNTYYTNTHVQTPSHQPCVNTYYTNTHVQTPSHPCTCIRIPRVEMKRALLAAESLCMEQLQKLENEGTPDAPETTMRVIARMTTTTVTTTVTSTIVTADGNVDTTTDSWTETHLGNGGKKKIPVETGIRGGGVKRLYP